MDVVFDIESNGLIGVGDTIHCVSLVIVETGEVREYRPDEIGEALEFLASPEVETLIGHNIAGFDIPFIYEVAGVDLRDKAQIDTLAVSKALFVATLRDADYKRMAKGSLPKHLVGRHSLESWGYRLGENKGDFGQSTDWQEFSEEMLSYCTQDVKVNVKLYNTLINFERIPGRPAMSREGMITESRLHGVCGEIERNGFTFDEEGAMKLVAQLQSEKATLIRDLQEIYPSRYVSAGEFTPKRPNRKMGYAAGATMTKIKLQSFNPGSDRQVGERLIEAGWVPTAFTPGGQPVVSEKALVEIDTDAIKGVDDLIRYKLVDKRLGQIFEGNGAWLKKVEDGRIHGRIQITGTRTGRSSHSSPNLAQVPAVGSFLGESCRNLFGPQDHGFLVGADASGLELRTLANRMAPYDNGSFAHEVVEGDVHEMMREASGLYSRNNQKTFTYATLYGAGFHKLGTIAAHDLRQAGKDVPSDINKLGSAVHKRLTTKLKGFGQLLSAAKAAHKRGFIRLVNGTHVASASEHSALNTLLQGDGAAVMKHALYLFDQRTRDIDFKLVGFIHDELQSECPTEEIAEQVGQIAVQSIQDAGKALGFRCPLDGEYKVGRNWCDTH